MPELKNRTIPKGIYIPPANPDYAKIVAAGYDTVQEAWDISAGEYLTNRLECAQGAAKENAAGGRCGFAEMDIHGHHFVMSSVGAKGGVKYVFSNDDLMFLVREGSVWGLSVRYLSAGLWEWGWTALQEHALEICQIIGFKCDDWDAINMRVSRCDYAFDFQSDMFASEKAGDLIENIVLSHKRKVKLTTSSEEVAQKSTAFETKGGSMIEVWANAKAVQTITIGKMPSLQLQVYNKTDEITEISGKDWMIELWQNSGRYEHGKPVYRLEIRFPKGFLKSRNMQSRELIQKDLFKIVLDALISNRLTHQKRFNRDTDDQRKYRWDLHPLWALIIDQCGVFELPPLGHRVTGKREALKADLIKQISGTLRSCTVLSLGKYEQEEMEKLGFKAIEQLNDEANDTGERFDQRKIDNAKARYSYVSEAG